MYEELFEELKSKKSELSEEEYKEYYNSIKEAKLSSDYLNSNSTNICRCKIQLRDDYLCEINNLMYCENGKNFIKRVPYLEYFLHDMNEFLKVKIVNSLEVDEAKKSGMSYDTFISMTRYLLKNFELLSTRQIKKNTVKDKCVYIIGLFNFVLEHSYYIYNVRVYTIDINKCKHFVNAIYNKILDIKQDLDTKNFECKKEYIDMYEDTIENIINKQYELITIIYDYYLEVK